MLKHAIDILFDSFDAGLLRANMRLYEAVLSVASLLPRCLFTALSQSTDGTRATASCLEWKPTASVLDPITCHELTGTLYI